ncbi:MAG: Ger(x)C family spore germination protein [Halanaerobiales bacterium]|nr:Ger(x)C family spore germination protein [Halanaerobiales bacterium]
MRLSKIGLILTIILIFLSGCWDSTELEDEFLVWGMGWDIAKDNPHLMTLTLGSPTTVEGAEEPFTTVSSTGHSVEEARMNSQVYIERDIELGHMRLLVISEEFAKKGIQKHLDSLGRNPNLSREVLIAVFKGKASELWDLKNCSNPLPVGYVVDLIKTNHKMARAASVTFRDFFESLSLEGKEPIASYLRLSKDKALVNAYAIAIFKEDKMVGTIQDVEVQVFKMIRGDVFSGRITVGEAIKAPDEQSITFAYRRGSRKIKSEVRNGKPYIYLQVELEGDISEYTSNAPVINDHNIEIAEKIIAERIKNELNKLIGKVQTDFKSDVFGFGEYFRAYHPTYWKSHTWEEEFPKAVVDVEVEVDIRRIGVES